MSQTHQEEHAQRLAVVTGAGGGLGRAIAAKLLSEGFNVALVDRDSQSLDSAADDLRRHHAAISTHIVDLTSQQEVRDLVARLRHDHATLDALVNNAGIESGGSIESQSVASWQQTMSVNVTAGFMLAQAIVPWWRTMTEAHIVNISSRTWLSGTSDPAYVASKAAVVGLTRALASELGAIGVNANAVAPSFVPSPMNAVKGDAGAIERYAMAFAAASPLRRLISAADVANTVSFLASPAARNITGEVIHVCAGAQLAPQIHTSENEA